MSAARSFDLNQDAVLPAAVIAAGLGGAVFAASAWAVGPLVLPGAIVLMALTTVTARRPEIGVAAGFLLVPLSNLGVTGDPPWLLTSVWGLYLCLLGLWRTHVRDAALPLLLPAAAVVVVGLVTFVVGGAVSDGVPEVRALVSGILYFTGIALLIRTERQVLWCIAGISAAIALVGLVALHDWTSGAPTAQAFYTDDGVLVGRVDAGFGHPNQLGGFLVILMPFALAGALIGGRLRPLCVAALMLGAFGIYASFSRTALVAMAAIPFLFIRGRRGLMLVPGLIALALVAMPGLVQERFATLTASGSELATRMDFWKTAAAIWLDHPLLGAGLGRFPSAYAAARVPGRAFLPGTMSEPPPHAHNLELQTLATEGLVGLVALALVVVLAIRLAVLLRRAPARITWLVGAAFLASLTALLVHNQFDVTLLEGTGMYFWALLGLLSACVNHLRPRQVHHE